MRARAATYCIIYYECLSPNSGLQRETCNKMVNMIYLLRDFIIHQLIISFAHNRPIVSADIANFGKSTENIGLSADNTHISQKADITKLF